MATPAPTQALSLAPVLAPFLAMLLAMGPAAEASPHAPPMDAAAAAGAENPPPYQLAPGDEIAVDFPYNAELNQKGPVGPDGRFAVPMLGSIVVAGQTLDEVSAQITQRLRDGGIVANARPVVSVRQYGGTLFVGGEVRQPGPIKLGQAMDPLQAVIAAGGLLDTARTNKVVILHRGADGTITRRTADLDAYTHMGRSPAVMLAAQDIVFVPRSSIAEADRWVDQHLNKLIPFSKGMTYNIGGGTFIP